jgi:phosphotransferase system HPr (HPr) family protein
MRPAMMLVDEAEKFNCNIILSKDDGSTADAESMMAVIMLAVLSGEEITITAEGEDELGAIDALEELITSNFNNLS